MHVRTIALHNDAQMLKTAVVQAKAIAVKTNNDTVEYNASSFKVAEGSAIDELIKKLPGAQVGSDGTITVNGKQITKILVNGRSSSPTTLKWPSKSACQHGGQGEAYDKRATSRLTGIDDGEEESVLDLTVKKDKCKAGLATRRLAWVAPPSTSTSAPCSTALTRTKFIHSRQWQRHQQSGFR